MHKKMYSLALSVYSHVRHGEYESAQYIIKELLDLINKEVEMKKSKEEVK